jgi:hypothetical protein
MHLNPESLSFALLISDLGSIARAANILGMKQATLSRKPTALENRVGLLVPRNTPVGVAQFEPDDLRGCIVIGGYERSETLVLARVLWCQQRTTGAVRILDLQDGKTYPDVTALLKQYVAYYLVNTDTDS